MESTFGVYNLAISRRVKVFTNPLDISSGLLAERKTLTASVER